MQHFTKIDLLLWSGSILMILLSFFAFQGGNILTLCASLIGVTSLIFAAKGNPAGQILMIAFSLLYGWISYQEAYYGEMITYLGMTMPMAVISLISWLKHPYEGDASQVEVNHVSRKEIIFMLILTFFVTAGFYQILKYFDTANLLCSTISVMTSFMAVYLTFRRSPYFAAGYALNDIILIILWVLASLKNPDCSSMIICFVVFFINDIYGFISWKKMEKRQNQQKISSKFV